MKKSRIKLFLTIIAIVFAQNAMAQVYSFSTTAINDGFFECSMDSFIRDVEKKNTLIEDLTYAKLEIVAAQRRAILINIAIASRREDIVELYDKTIDQSDGSKYKRYFTKIILENGEALSINDATLYDIRKEGYYKGTNTGIGFIGGNCWNTESNKVAMNNFSNLQKQQYICQQLRSHSITKVVINGVTIEFKSFKTKDTFNAMFDALAAKTGEGDLYRSSGSSSSSSNVSSGPSASCELGYVGITSEGNIYCRVDNVTISGAKGKDVSICAFFEDVNNDEFCVFEKKLSSLPYDDCTYNSLRVKGNVNDYSMLTKYRNRRYKVTISVLFDNHSIYDSNEKYITIYNNQGSWRSN